MRFRAWIAAACFVAALGPASAASAAAPALYVAEAPGLQLILKAEKGDIYITSFHRESFCHYDGVEGSPSEDVVGEGRTSVGPPTKLHRVGNHVRRVDELSVVFWDYREVFDAEIHPREITGSFYRDESSDIGSCRTGGFTGNPHVEFTAKRYVPFDDPLAEQSDAPSEDLYFGSAAPIEIYLWVTGGSVTRLQGSARQVCWQNGEPYHAGEAFGLNPPFELAEPNSRFEARSSTRDSSQFDSAALTGRVEPDAATGSYRRVSAYLEPGPDKSSCRTGRRGGNGYVHYRAIRYVPAVATEL